VIPRTFFGKEYDASEACSSLQFQQSVKKGTIALQGKPQILSGHVVTAVPLLFQSRPLVGGSSERTDENH
jgi:hypothetical protein